MKNSDVLIASYAYSVSLRTKGYLAMKGMLKINVATAVDLAVAQMLG